MPAERTRTKRGVKEERLTYTWSAPVDASTPQSIAFAPNVTPGTYFDTPSSVDAVPNSTLFPASPDLPATKRSTHSRKKPDNHIPRPPNAFILFRSSFIKNQHVSSEVETNHSTLSKIIGMTWTNLPLEERQIWHAKAKAALEEHRKKFPEYAFRPAQPKSKAAPEKRKVREVGPKDMKRCAKIAELLVEGKKGAELDAAIQEFDRHHVPEIVTRFETPITARSYRRSSSAPAPETEATKQPTFLAVSSSPATGGSSKTRASSSRPDASSIPASPEDYYSPPSELDANSVNEFIGSPSPFGSQSDLYSISSENPSFEFNTFSFDTCAALPAETCDPLSTSNCQGRLDLYTPEMHYAPQDYALQEEPYPSSPLTIDTTFLDSWSSAPSPLSSVPTTPHSYHDHELTYESHTALTMDHNDMPPLVANPCAESFEFYGNHGSEIAHNGGLGIFNVSALPLQYGAPHVGHPKAEMVSLYGRYSRSALQALDESFPASSYMASTSTFAM